MKIDSNILITGSDGMVGKAVVSKLKSDNYSNLLLPNFEELDIRDQKKLDDYFVKNKPEYVIHLAARVGGIAANIAAPAEFLYDNLMIECNVIHAAHKYGVKKLLFLGSSCIYPRGSKQPMKEEYLLSGKLEPTNEGYALAKICGLKLCEYYNRQYGSNFISIMPCNIYGINDHFDPKNSHVISALILKFHEAKKKDKPFVEVWGTGSARREFLYVDDAAEAILYFINHHDSKDMPPFVNTGYGADVSIRELAEMVKKITEYNGEIRFNTDYPDGMSKKLLDSSRARVLGWSAKISLQEGVKKTYEWFLKNKSGGSV
ncbi:NAD-dependent epimerase/dehydratase family protein [Candidatus Woesearchaeota archaeon]|nr:NAD-dependent epimerase/dehydratase family protein [Candidatus Woesearchaeota archaeon]